MSSIRAFLAINLPVPVVRRLTDEVRALQPAVKAAGLEVAWVPAANVHLTLKFFGNIDPVVVAAIQSRLSSGLRAHPPFELEARGLGAFPDARRPRILWAGLRESAPLLALQKDIEDWMEEIGFEREARTFHPHLTLGRVKHGGAQNEETIATLLGEREKALFGGGRITEVVLYESRTLRAGAEYTPLTRVALGAPGHGAPGAGERKTPTRPT
ncbi:MAG TPA: RNA 2',3'-cyclic phosphodiesterase [Polyangia bacterium]|jgi:2'-5' RNA ligase|nr:RNA 2',3'-cyclic phosphodiesterase [Polyangia bacterium]